MNSKSIASVFKMIRSVHSRSYGIHRQLFVPATKSDKVLFKQVRREYQAVERLLRRSGITEQTLGNLVKNARGFHLSCARFEADKDKDKNKDTKKDGDKDKEEEEESKVNMLAKAALWMLASYMVIVLMSLLFPNTDKPEVVRYVSWNEFVHQMLATGEVEEMIVKPDINLVTIVLHDNAIIKGRKSEHKTYHMNILDVDRFEEKLRAAETNLGIRAENGVHIVYERNQESTWLLLVSLVAVSLMILLMFRSGTIKVDVPKPTDLFSQLGRAKMTIVDPLTGGRGVRFKDVAGLREAKIEVMEFVDYLKKPEHYKKLGARPPKGALLLGPPGCGKTLLAKAVSTEANVPFLSMAGSEFIEMIGGLGAARVRDLFKEARKRSPCIIYIDELDAIGKKRSSNTAQMSTGEEEQTLNQLLVEMDGMASKEGVIMLASTNRADVLDKALLRPGRFDRHILIDLPTLIERKEIFEQHLKRITLAKEPSYYSNRMAHLTPRMSGADIANICNEAALHAARFKHKVVDAADLEYAVERVIGGTEKRSNVISPEEKRVIAFHESGHAVVGWMLKHTDALLKVTIVPRTSNVLGFAQYTPIDQKLHSYEELVERMSMALGGRVAEALIFNRITSGAQNDLQKVTKMAYSMVRTYGMNEKVGLVSFTEEEQGGGRKPYSKQLSALIDNESRRLTATAYQMAERVLKENIDKLKLMAEALLQKEVLNYDDVVALIGVPPHGNKRAIMLAELEGLVEEHGRDTTIPGDKPPPPPPEDMNGQDGDEESGAGKRSDKQVSLDPFSKYFRKFFN